MFGRVPEHRIRKAHRSHSCEAFERVTHRLEHGALAPLSERRLAEWLDEVGEALDQLVGLWSERVGGTDGLSSPPATSTRRPRLDQARARLGELGALHDEVVELQRRLAEDGPARAVLDRAWTLRDRVIFASVEVRVFEDSLARWADRQRDQDVAASA